MPLASNPQGGASRYERHACHPLMLNCHHNGKWSVCRSTKVSVTRALPLTKVFLVLVLKTAKAALAWKRNTASLGRDVVIRSSTSIGPYATFITGQEVVHAYPNTPRFQSLDCMRSPYRSTKRTSLIHVPGPDPSTVLGVCLCFQRPAELFPVQATSIFCFIDCQLAPLFYCSSWLRGLNRPY